MCLLCLSSMTVWTDHTPVTWRTEEETEIRRELPVIEFCPHIFVHNPESYYGNLCL